MLRKVPFRAEGPGEVMAMHIFRSRSLREVDPHSRGGAIHRMMSKEPHERPTMTQVATELEKDGDDEHGTDFRFRR